MLKVLIKAPPTFPAETKKFIQFSLLLSAEKWQRQRQNRYASRYISRVHSTRISTFAQWDDDKVATGEIPAVRIHLLDFGSHLI